MEDKQKNKITIILAGVIGTIILFWLGVYIWHSYTAETLKAEGEKYAKEYFDPFVIKCGEKIYISGKINMIFNGKLMEFDRLIEVEYANVSAVPSKEFLTWEEYSNGIQWKGSLFIVNGKNREYDRPYKRWNPWSDDHFKIDSMIGSSLYKASNGWHRGVLDDYLGGKTSNLGTLPVPISCPEIPQ